jgi:hypothetical protein
VLQTATSGIVGVAAFTLRPGRSTWLRRKQLPGVDVSAPALAEIQGHVDQLVGVDGLPRRLRLGRRVSGVASRLHFVHALPGPVDADTVALVVARGAQHRASSVLLRCIVLRAALALCILSVGMARSRAARKGGIEQEAAAPSCALLAVGSVFVVDDA